MTAKRSIRKTLEDRSLSMEEMYSTALVGAKERHMSKPSLSKVMSELAGHDIAQNTADKTVEDVVTELMKDAFSGLHHHNDNDGSNNDGEKEGEVQLVQCDSYTNTDTNLKDTSVRTDTPCMSDQPNTANHADELASTIEKASCVLTKSENCKSTTNMMCIPKASLDSLFEKIDSLTEMVSKQKEELHDLEARLKTEIKTRENHLVEVMESFFFRTEGWKNRKRCHCH